MYLCCNFRHVCRHDARRLAVACRPAKPSPQKSSLCTRPGAGVSWLFSRAHLLLQDVRGLPWRPQSLLSRSECSLTSRSATLRHRASGHLGVEGAALHRVRQQVVFL
jgi:hypothetical protein